MARAMKLACVFLACMIVAGPITANALSCGTVMSSLGSCLGYLTQGAPLPAACCNGVKSVIKGSARTSLDRKQACSCIKQILELAGANAVRASGLPRACKVTVPYPISPSTDCSKVV